MANEASGSCLNLVSRVVLFPVASYCYHEGFPPVAVSWPKHPVACSILSCRLSSSEGDDILPDSPDKADELARNGGTDLVLELAACHQVSKALTQPLLRRPGDLQDLRRCTLGAPLQ